MTSTSQIRLVYRTALTIVNILTFVSRNSHRQRSSSNRLGTITKIVDHIQNSCKWILKLSLSFFLFGGGGVNKFLFIRVVFDLTP